MACRRPDDIVCFEVGSAETSPWIGSIRDLQADLAALEAQVRHRVIQMEITGDQVRISGNARVGMVVLPSGRRLIVRSKIPSLAILEWLAYLGELPRLAAWLPDSGVARGDEQWFRCLARLYLYAMEIVTQRHLRREYVTVRAETPEIRGRIAATALARRLHRLPRVPQVQRRRVFDTPFNMVLALALDRLPLLLDDGDTGDRKRLARLRDQWASIRRPLEDRFTAVALAQGACPPGYREALQLAKLILVGAALEPESHMGGQAFTLSLAAIWERALRRMFDELGTRTRWRRVGDDRRTCHWADSTGPDDKTRLLMADILLERGEARWVLDAKYKRGFGDEGRTDRFQMCAYALAFGAQRASLVYPTASGGAMPVRTLLSAVVEGRRIAIDSIELPMAAGPDVCFAALAEIMARPESSHRFGSHCLGQASHSPSTSPTVPHCGHL